MLPPSSSIRFHCRFRIASRCSAETCGKCSSRYFASFALKALKILEKAGQLPAAAVVTHIGPALFARQKGTVLEAIKLLDRAAKMEPGLKGQVSRCAAEALRHESPEVQRAVLDLIQKHGTPTDESLVQVLLPQAGELAASERPRLLAWLGTAPEKPAQVVGKSQPTESEALALRARNLDRGIAKLAGVEPAPAVDFEDATAGVQAGHSGKFGCVVGVNRSDADHGADLRKHGADIVVTDLSELL